MVKANGSQGSTPRLDMLVALTSLPRGRHLAYSYVACNQENAPSDTLSSKHRVEHKTGHEALEGNRSLCIYFQCHQHTLLVVQGSLGIESA